MQARARGAMVLATIVVAAACGGGAGNDNNSPPPMQSAVLVRTNPTLSFLPKVDSISRGGTVTWTWDVGSTDHNIISTGSPSFPNDGTASVSGTKGVDYFDAPHTYQFTFNTAGSHKYYCSTHGTTTSPDPGGTGMGGVIVVVP